MDLSPKTIANIPSVVYKHLKNNNINWVMTIWSLLMHSLFLKGLTVMSQCKAETHLFAYLLCPLTGISVTAGAHRLWSHRSYEAHFIVRVVLMLFFSMANQTSIYHWARDHRVHHKHSETSADPHNATRGFFFAHIGWLLLKKDRAVSRAGKEMDHSDLLEDPVVRFQLMLDPIFPQFMCFVVPASICHFGWGEDFWNAMLIAGVVRYVSVKHFTFMVNSAAHLYGDHPYDTASFPAENPFVSVFTAGEGWHNWHHKYPYDYACSEFGVLSQFNPTKLTLDVLASMGLVWNRKRALVAWAHGRARRDRDEAAGIPYPRVDTRPWQKKKA